MSCQAPAVAPSVGSSIRILFVDDDPAVVKYSKQFLDSFGYLVDVASDGKSGLALASKRNYDAIVLDQFLPGGFNGTDVLGALREQGIATPVLIITGFGGEQLAFGAAKLGAANYRAKPLFGKELLQAIRATAVGGESGLVLDERREKTVHRIQLSEQAVDDAVRAWLRVKGEVEKRHPTVAEIGQVLGLTELQLRRKFHSDWQTGGAPQAASPRLKTARQRIAFGCVMYAAELIRAGYKIWVAREHAGFRPGSSFNRAFKRFTGCLPSEYRTRLSRSRS